MTTSTNTPTNTGTETSKSVSEKSLQKNFYRAVWRWHFYAGLYVVPFLIMLAVTGVLMMVLAQINGRDGEFIEVTPQSVALPVSTQAESALALYPKGQLVEWIGPVSASNASVFRVKNGKANHMIAVNPYDATVIEQWVRRDGWYDFLSDIHGELLIGDVGDRLIEIAAGFTIVLTITGLYLWWPRGNQRWSSVLIPNVRARGRRFWKSMHSVIGYYVSVLLIVFMVTGLAWAGIWGGKFVQPWSTFPAEKWNNVPLSDETHASMNHGAIKDVPWGLEQTPMPESGSKAGITGLPAGTAVNVNSVQAFAGSIGYEGRFRIHFPKGETGVWTLSQDSMSNDSHDPTIDRTVHIDQYTGKMLADVGFDNYSLPAKGMAVGIAFHEGDMGWWNVILNIVFCLSVVFLSVSGVVMWWLRRPEGAKRLAAPPIPTHLPLFKGAVLLMLVLSLAFPLVGLTLVAVLLLDYFVISRISLLKNLLS